MADPTDTARDLARRAGKIVDDFWGTPVDETLGVLRGFAAALRSRAGAAEAECARLRGLLRPFAEMGNAYHPFVPDEGRVANWWPRDDENSAATVGDCRAAAESPGEGPK